MPSILLDVVKHASLKPASRNTGAIKNLVFVLFDEFYFFKFDLLIAEFLGRTKGRTAVVLSSYNRFVGLYCRLVGIETIRLPEPNSEEMAYARAIFASFEEACFDLAQEMVDKRQAIGFVYEGIPYGKLIVSDFLGRTRVSQYSNMFLDKSIRNGLIQRLAMSVAFDRLLNEHKSVNLFGFNEKNFLPANVIAFKGRSKGRVFEWKPTQRRHEICVKLFTDETWHSHPFSLNLAPDDFDALLGDSSTPSEGARWLKEKYENNNWYNRDILLVKGGQSIAKLETKVAEMGPSGVVGIFPHIFWDATFSYGENYFVDYNDLFDDLFDLIPRHPKVLFVVKFHPDYAFKNAQAGKDANADFSNALAKLRSCQNVVIFYPNDTVNLFELMTQIDTIVTVRGTVGIEGALLGKNVSVFGTGRYSAYGFTHTYRSVEAFDQDLAKSNGKKPAPDMASQRAALFWNELYEKAPINLSRYLLFSPHGSSVKNPLRINYVIKGWINLESDAANRLSEVLK